MVGLERPVVRESLEGQLRFPVSHPIKMPFCESETSPFVLKLQVQDKTFQVFPGDFVPMSTGDVCLAWRLRVQKTILIRHVSSGCICFSQVDTAACVPPSSTRRHPLHVS